MKGLEDTDQDGLRRLCRIRSDYEWSPVALSPRVRLRVLAITTR